MKIKNVVAMLFAVFAISGLSAQEKIEWIKIDQLEKSIGQTNNQGKKILIDCYTDWCGWCKRMDKDTFSDTLIAKIMNYYFIAVKFDAECQENITFKGKEYKSNGTTSKKKNPHQLAYYLLNNRLSYPSFSIMNTDLNVIEVIAGYNNPNEFEKMLVFFGEGLNTELDYNQFAKEYETKYKADILKKINRTK